MKHCIQTGCLILGILCLFYYAAIVLYAGITADFAWIWVFGGVLLLLLRRGLLYQKAHPESAVRFWNAGLIVLFLAGFVLVLVIGGRVAAGMFGKPKPDLDYVIVLGAQVKGNVPSRALRKRLDCAAAYAGENPDTVVILSGGKGSGEDISEAECMYQYLLEKGIDQKRMILEDRSTSTWENLNFSAKLADVKQKKTGLVSNNFHIYRSVQLAKKAGYQHISGIPAPSDLGMQPHYVLREVFAVLAGVLRGQLRLF